MKRKIFSKLLMGAFLIASVSSFVSCKDYDDDINNLQKQIDAAALKAELTTLQTNLAAQIAAAQSAAQAAQAAAEKAQATANNAATKDALEAVKTLATAAGTDAAKAIADAANAQNTADVAKSAATAAQEAAAAAQNVANGASDKAATALADAAKALATAEAANATATAANATASAADATAKEAKATADNAIAAAGNATTQAADALKAAGEAKAAAEAAKYNDEAVKLLIAQAQASADAAAEDAKEAAEAAAAAVLASASATEDAATAKEAAAKAEETIKDAIANATKAIEEATDAKIKAAVAEAVAKIPTDQSEAVAEQAAAIETLKGNLQTLADAQGKLATAEGLAAAVEDLEGKLDATAEAAAVAAVAAAAGTIAEAFDALYTAVTSVELVATYSGNIKQDLVTFPLGFGTFSSPSVNLDFIFGKMAWTATFGDKETEDGYSQTSGAIEGFDGVEKVSYVKDEDIRADRALLVRVNPTNATFTKEQVKLINSQMGNLDAIVEIGDPYRFEGLITRSEMESGLWVIPVKVVKNTDEKTFNSTTFYGRTYNANGTVKNAGKAICYAVAINNTTDPEDAEVSRYVASTYDIKAEWVKYTPATYLDAELYDGDKYKGDITDFHNRWTNNVGNDENVPGILSKDQDIAYTLKNPEKCWAQAGQYASNSKEYAAGLRIPSDKPMKATVDGKEKWNTVNADNLSWDNDYRFSKPFYYIKNVGDVITVALPTNLKRQVEYWYISYDFELNAVESAPSEWEAWKSYMDGIEGIYTMTRGAEPIDLVINKEEAQGDVIGFRVWAVNYDGSLVDPDGKAFYVKVGEEPAANKLTINASLLAVDATAAMALNYLQDEDKTYTPEKGFNVSTLKAVDASQFKSLAYSAGFSGTTEFTGDGKTSTNIVNGQKVKIYWALLKSDKKTVATNWKDIAYIKVGVAGNQLKNWRDDQTLKVADITRDRIDAYNKEKYQVVINVTKTMPDDAWTKKIHFDGKITWKPEAGYDAAINTLNVYAKPYYDKAGIGDYVLNPKFIPHDAPVPSEFYWRWGGSAANKLVDFINDAAWLSWTDHEANAGVRNIYDYISKPETSDAFPRELYKFQFINLPTQLKGTGEPVEKNYETQWDEAATKYYGDKAVVAVMPKAVRDEKTYTTNLVFTYKNISATSAKIEDGVITWNASNDLERNATTFQTDFKDALDLIKYTTSVAYLKYDKWEENDIHLPVVKDKLILTDDNLYIAWKGGNGTFNWSSALAETQNGATAVFFQLALDDHTKDVVGEYNSQHFVPSTYTKDYTIHTTPTNDLTSFLQPDVTAPAWTLASGTYIAPNYTGAGLDTYYFNKKHYQFDNPATTDVDETGTMQIKLDGQIAKYLKVVTGSTVDAITLEKISGIAAPTQNWSGTIEITGYDVYGKGHSFILPVVLLYNF